MPSNKALQTDKGKLSCLLHSQKPRDVTEDVVRELALPRSLVDVKVCAVEDTWSGLKLVIRKSERG